MTDLEGGASRGAQLLGLHQVAQAPAELGALHLGLAWGGQQAAGGGCQGVSWGKHQPRSDDGEWLHLCAAADHHLQEKLAG